MKTRSFFQLVVVAAAAWATMHTASAQNVWLVEPGTLVVTPSFTYQSFDTFYAGTTKVTLPGNITQRTGSLRFDYGLAPRLALDAGFGYTDVRFAPPGASFKRNGRDDSRLGLTYTLLPENVEMPAVTFRVGAIIAGGYSVPNTLPPINPGDGASGFETSLAAGKSLGGGFAAYGELGYRNRNHNVPDDIFGSAGVAARFGPIGLNVGYRRTQGLSGGDIGGRGFGTRFGFPQVKTLTQVVEGGVSFTDSGGRSYQFIVAQKVGSARNIGDLTIYGFSISLPFKL